jgi:tRNA-specific 2-thiouridylase
VGGRRGLINRMKRKVLVLTSGGLDSLLTLKIMGDEGLEVTGVHFLSWFNTPKYRLPGDFKKKDEILGFPILNVDISEDYTDVLLRPRYGYGSGVNPCIDCKILFFKKAWALAGETGADFVASGEVVGQRPMSQKKNIMKLIERSSGLEGYLLRPLSARLLSPTVPETEGWVNRENLHAISGRERKVQMEMAVRLGIGEYPSPAGGCILTEKGFKARFRDLVEHTAVPGVDDFFILRYGRHFRISEGCKLVVGRNRTENDFLRRLGWGNLKIDVCDVPGPYSVMMWDGATGTIRKALRIIARYSDAASIASKKDDAVGFEIDFGTKRRVIFHRGRADHQETGESIIR